MSYLCFYLPRITVDFMKENVLLTYCYFCVLQAHSPWIRWCNGGFWSTLLCIVHAGKWYNENALRVLFIFWTVLSGFMIILISMNYLITLFFLFYRLYQPAWIWVVRVALRNHWCSHHLPLWLHTMQGRLMGRIVIIQE